MNKTYNPRPAEISRKWYLVDASDATLGRIASQVAQLLTGKGKTIYAPHIDCGDYVVVINADKLVVTGNKLEDKIYYRHSGFPGGIKQRSLRELIAKDPTAAIMNAVKGMISANKLRDERLKRLKVYAGSEHNHDAQKPVKLELKDK